MAVALFEITCNIANTMTFAVIQTGGKQYKVTVGDILKIEKLAQEQKENEAAIVHEVGTKVTFDQVMLVDDGTSSKIGAPYIAGAKVTASVVANDRHKKVMVIKYRPKSRYYKKNGHRQPFTEVKIESIG
jgi:large subunit ribosomal protein L21